VWRNAFGLPRLHLPAGLIADPAPELLHRPGTLRNGNERAGREQSARLVIPPHQGLDAGQAPGRELDLRLIVKFKFAVLDRRP